jgi:hypothetical protein
MASISIAQMAKLAKVFSGDLSVDKVIELARGFGLEVASEEIPGDRKGDAFRQVAQFAVQSETQVFRGTIHGPNGLRVEVLFAASSSHEGNSDQHQKLVDDQRNTEYSLVRAH